MGLYQTQKFPHRKKKINKMKRQPTEWEKNLQIISEKG